MQTAGYIVRSAESMIGYGDTPDAAWHDFVRRVEGSGRVLRPAGSPAPKQPWIRPSAYQTRPATPALLDALQALGGAGTRMGRHPTLRWTEAPDQVCDLLG